MATVDQVVAQLVTRQQESIEKQQLLMERLIAATLQNNPENPQKQTTYHLHQVQSQQVARRC